MRLLLWSLAVAAAVVFADRGRPAAAQFKEGDAPPPPPPARTEAEARAMTAEADAERPPAVAAKDAATTAGTGVAAAYEYQVGRYFYYQAYLAETAPFECALIEWYLTCADQYGARAVTYYDTGVRNFNEAEAAYAGIGNPPDFDQVYLAALTAKLGYLNTQFWCPEAVLQLDGCVTCTLYAAQLMDRFVP